MSAERTSGQFILYVLIAISSAASDVLVFAGLVFCGVNPLLCQAVARVAGGVTSFALNRNHNFPKSDGWLSIEVRRFLVLYVASYTLSLFCFWLFHRVFKLPLICAKPLVDGLCFLFNFMAMKMYVYAKVPGITATFQGYLNSRMSSR